MKKLNIFILLLTIILCFGLLSGCAVKPTTENLNFEINKSIYSDGSSYSTIYIDFSIKAHKSLYKMKVTFDILDKDGKIIDTKEKDTTFSINEETKLFTYKTSLFSIISAEKVVINNVKYYYDNNWIYGVCFGSVSFGALIVFVCFFIKLKIKDKKNPESIK